jgi:hypothetical protein
VSPAVARDWTRPLWREAGAIPVRLDYRVYGRYDGRSRPDLPAHRSRGLPRGVEAVVEPIDASDLLCGPLAAAFAGDAAALATARAAPHVLRVHGEFADQSDLDFLRDVVGFVAALEPLGAVAVLDVLMPRLWAMPRWRADVHAPDRPVLHEHVAIWRAPDPAAADRVELSTRGLRRFGRPDVLLANIPEARLADAHRVIERCVDFQVAGGRIASGRELVMKDVPAGLVARWDGRLDDPRFNNLHIVLRWPDGG